MNKIRTILILSLALSVVEGLTSKPPPVSEIFQNPTFQSFKISPDGRYVAGLMPYEGSMNVFAFDLETREPRVLSAQKMDVTNYYWVNDTRIFYSINQGDKTLDSMRNQGAVFGVNADGTDHKVMVKSALERQYGRGEKRGGIEVIHRLPKDPDHVLVLNNLRRRYHPDLYLLDVNSGKLTKKGNNPGYVSNYFIDEDGEILGGVWWQNTDEFKAEIYFRNKDNNEWFKVADVEDLADAPEWLGLSTSGKSGYVSVRNEEGSKSIYTISMSTGQMSAEPVLSDPVYDIDNPRELRSLKSRRVIGLRYEQDKPKNHYFSKTYVKLQKMIDDAIPNASNYISNFSNDGKRVVIASVSDRKSPEYFLMDMNTMAMEPLGTIFPNLKGLKLPEQRPIVYKARDGHPIHGYLILPENYDGQKPVPLIVNPHGGPWARDTWGIRWWFDLVPVFLASRGFAVLQTNFRSSTGYGKEHRTVADKNLYISMEDVYDGVKWAIAEGYADPDRVGIMGASYGGYATMIALVKEPDMFQFGVNFFGVVDIPMQIERYYKQGNDLGGDHWKRKVGDPDISEERAKLDDWSAINFLDKLDDPLFIYHGLVDVQVDIEQTRLLVRKLKSLGRKQGKDFIVELDIDEGHGAYNAEKRIALYEKLDEFLKPFSPAWGN